MCGRYTHRTRRSDDIHAKLADTLGVETPPSGRGFERFNIAPTQQVLAVVDDRDGRRIEELRWGLVPHWAQERQPSLLDDQCARRDPARSPACSSTTGSARRPASASTPGSSTPTAPRARRTSWRAHTLAHTAEAARQRRASGAPLVCLAHPRGHRTDLLAQRAHVTGEALLVRGLRGSRHRDEVAAHGVELDEHTLHLVVEAL